MGLDQLPNELSVKRLDLFLLCASDQSFHTPKVNKTLAE